MTKLLALVFLWVVGIGVGERLLPTLCISELFDILKQAPYAQLL